MKYLIFCGPGIGDFVMLLPMVRAIKQSDEGAYVKMITVSSKERFKITKELFGLQHYVDDIDYYSAREVKHSVVFMIKNLLQGFDEGYVIQYTFDNNISRWPNRIVKLCSSKTFGISGANNSIRYDYAVAWKKGYRKILYTSDLLALSGKSDKYNANKPVFDDVLIKRQVPKWLSKGNRKLITLCVGTAAVSRTINGKKVSAKPKQWPFENWIRLAGVLSRLGFVVFLMGGEDERKEIMNYGLANLNDYCVDGIGKCTVKESIGVISISDLVIGADTGMMHCAGALHIPNIVLFGCTDWQEYLPYGGYSTSITANEPCSPCFGVDSSVLCPYNNRCMARITLKCVLEKTLQILNKD